MGFLGKTKSISLLSLSFLAENGVSFNGWWSKWVVDGFTWLVQWSMMAKVAYGGARLEGSLVKG